MVFCESSHCGVNNPTWSELSHFVTFLGTQLKTCEQSVFCDEKLVGDVMSGLKTFVVKFMMRMSKVCSQYHAHKIFCFRTLLLLL